MIRSAVDTRGKDFGANVNGTFVVPVEIKDEKKMCLLTTADP